jgi:ABC-type nitrate/sulfonate/bicarbonate transport system substrate-binding protein
VSCVKEDAYDLGRFQVLMALLFSALTATGTLAAEMLTAGYSSISPAEWTVVTASKANLFEKYGLDVATVYLGGSTRIVQVMIAGDIQIGQIGGSAALFGKAAGVDMAYIATTINSMAAQVMSRPEVKQIIDLKAGLWALPGAVRTPTTGALRSDSSRPRPRQRRQNRFTPAAA